MSVFIVSVKKQTKKIHKYRQNQEKNKEQETHKYITNTIDDTHKNTPLQPDDPDPTNSHTRHRRHQANRKTSQYPTTEYSHAVAANYQPN